MTDRSRPRDAHAAATRLVERLNRLPKAVAFLGALALGLVAFFTPGAPGALLVGLLATAVGARLGLTWQRQPTPQRATQILLLGVLLLIAWTKLNGPS